MKGMDEVRTRVRALYAIERRTHRESDELAYLDTVLMSQSFLEGPDTFVAAYPNSGDDVKEMYYYDQAPTSSHYWDRKIQSFYTQYGISLMDSHFGRMIREELLEPEIIEKMIRRNPHLHNVIKTNLLSNLEEVKKLQN